jgi:hypothetical protein
MDKPDVGSDKSNRKKSKQGTLKDKPDAESDKSNRKKASEEPEKTSWMRNLISQIERKQARNLKGQAGCGI